MRSHDGPPELSLSHHPSSFQPAAPAVQSRAPEQSSLPTGAFFSDESSTFPAMELIAELTGCRLCARAPLRPACTGRLHHKSFMGPRVVEELV